MPPSAPGRRHWAARNVTIGQIANALNGFGDLGRPVVDQTGLSGNFDFSFEWAPDLVGPALSGADSPLVGSLAGGSQPVPSGLSFQEALKAQFGLKLESQKGPVDVIVLDHVEHPSEN